MEIHHEDLTLLAKDVEPSAADDDLRSSVASG